MDEKELIKIGMEVALRPVTEVAENAIGVLGGDWLSEKRRFNREKLVAKTDAALRRAGVKEPVEPSPSIVLPLLSEAQEESRDELLEIWGRLLAAAMDPVRCNTYRREFVTIAKQLEPIDAAVLRLLDTGGPLAPDRATYVATTLGKPHDEVYLAFRNLARMDLVQMSGGVATQVPFVTLLGRQFLSIVA